MKTFPIFLLFKTVSLPCSVSSSPEFTMEGRKLIVRCQKYIGIAAILEPKQKFVRVGFHCVIMLFANFLILWGFRMAEDLTLRVQLGFNMVFYMILTLVLSILVRQGKPYDSCLDWCDRLYEKALNWDQLKPVFEKCAEESYQIVARIQTGFKGILTFAFMQFLVLSIYHRRFEPFFRVTLPSMSEDNLVSGFICATWLMCAACTICSLIFLSFAAISSIIRHFIAVLESMKVLLATAEAKNFDRTVRVVVQMHCDLLERRNDLIVLTRPMILCFEFAVYAILLFTWMVVFFEPSLLMVALAASGLFILYFQITWINEGLVDSFRDFSFFLYDMEWYTLKPKQRLALMQIMMIMNKPRILMAGPFHAVDFDNFKIMVQRVYSYGIVINKIIGGHFA